MPARIRSGKGVRVTCASWKSPTDESTWGSGFRAAKIRTAFSGATVGTPGTNHHSTWRILIPDAGFDVLNWGLETSMTKACEKVGGRLTLMGNVPPLDLGVRGTPEQNYAAARKAMQEAGDHPLILSFGGATTTGVSPDNVRALARAARDAQRESGVSP